MIADTLLTLVLALQPREEAVEVPKAGFSVKIVHVPVDGTPLRPYALGKHEVAWAEYNAFYVEDSLQHRIIDGLTRPSIGRSYFGQVQCPEAMMEPRKPAIGLRWHNAMAYCDWLTALSGRKFRLPTEAEWEHAARGGGATADLDARAWHAGNSAEITHAPGTSKADAWGLHDLLGNVWEICLESMAPPAHAPVYRGGAWSTPKAELSPGLRTRVPAEWFGADPNKPRSVWWLTSGFSQGMRPACVGDAEALKGSALLAGSVAVRLLKHAEKNVPLAEEDREKVISSVPEFYMTVQGEVENRTDRTLEELELQVYFLEPDGRPHFLEKEGAAQPSRPNYSWAYPVLVSGPEGASKKPLAPGEKRSFSVDLPMTFDPPQHVQADALGARVTWVRPAP